MPARIADPSPGCKKCGHVKVRNASGKLYCKACAAQTNCEYRARNAAEIRRKKQARYLRDRVRYLERNRANYQANREAYGRTARAWSDAHPELRRKYKQKWASANPERGREYAGRRRALVLTALCEHGPDCVTATTYAGIKGEGCTYCGSPAVHADHYIPLSRGGLHCVDNIVPACKFCNLSKNNQMPDEWLASLEADAS